MLTADLVHVRRKKGQLEVAPLGARTRDGLMQVATSLIDICATQVGSTRGELLAAWDDVTRSAKHPKRIKGLQKLLLDRCTFQEKSEIDPKEVRQTVFRMAAQRRRGLEPGVPFSHAAILEGASAELGLQVEEIPDALFSDLKENHKLLHFEPITAPALFDLYERAQRQAVLLRATSITVILRPGSPGQARLFFQRLKFRQLLYTIRPLPNDAFEIQIDGPLSLFQAVTKYGLQLALLLPALEDCAQWELQAEVLWGKARERYAFHLSGERSPAAQSASSPVSDEVERLRTQLLESTPDWNTEVCNDILSVPGIGLCVPDLTFTHHDTGHRVHLEVLGFWSRNAVWKRVELVENGLMDNVIFAVSKRLRVSEEVLSDALPSQLYVYKGVMSPKAIRERLNAIALE